MRVSKTRLRHFFGSVGALLQHNMFVRWMAAFSVIAVISIAMFSYFFFSYISRSMVEEELDNQAKAMDRVGEYLEDRYEFAQSFMNNIYRDNRISRDMLNYIRLPFEEYISDRLDQSFDFTLNGPGKMTELFKNTLQDQEDLQHMMLYSAERQYLHVFSRGRRPHMYHTNAALSYIPDVMAAESSIVSAPNVWIRKTAKVEGDLISIRVPVNDPLSMLNIGQMLFYFRPEGINDLLRGTGDKLKGHIVVMSLEGQVLFDSASRYYGKPFPYMDKISEPSGREMLEHDSYYTIAPHYNYGFIVAGITPVKELAEVYQGVKRMIIAISAVCILIVVLIPSIVVMNFAKRTYQIIRFMRKAENGDLKARLPEDKEDELGQISRSFNRMMEELSRHIEQVYKAEIKQKHTELTALQARVQPHFLYNTLEVIRMRAVASGVSDVGEMIYSLAMLFKSFVRPEHHTPLQDELENCRLYLELFRIRYKDLFTYSIDYEPSLEQATVVRMLLQPVIENYIVHGLRMNEKDNAIAIRAFRRGDDIVIEVSDNGKGIPPEKMTEIADRLKLREENGHSFGLRSVHERLELLFGAPYGLTLEARQGGGTIVTLMFPMRQEEAAQAM